MCPRPGRPTLCPWSDHYVLPGEVGSTKAMIAKGAVEFDDLLAAFDWVNASYEGDNSAFVCRETGNIHWDSNSADIEDDLPDDVDDGRLYVAVPHGAELGLGRRLALAFTEQVLPESVSEVSGFFRRPGAYPRFRELLDRVQRLDEWREFERAAIARALREWAEEHGVRVRF